MQLALGAILVFVNFAEYEDVGILPGGHSEFYFIGAIGLMAASSWWFGWFDRPR